MIDIIIVGTIVAIACIFVIRRFLRPFLSKNTSCGCSGCGQPGSCSAIKDGPDKPDCCGTR